MLDNVSLNNIIKKSKSLKILYVEDDNEVRLHVSKLLKLIFNNIQIASNGKEALKTFNTEHIDIILTDINMPIMDGLTLASKIREENFSIPILIISAHNDQKFIVDAIRIGIDGFIFKPLETKQFFDSIKKAIEKAYLLKENAKNILVLEQYQEIANKSTIISKTDPEGRITFVNNNFCKISGYTKEELIGKPHNIIRHPDNPKELFEDLWRTIKKEKKSWKGIIRNISKDGKSYFVKSTIKPILDQNGDIIEYMALRDDVTEIMSEKKQLRAIIESQKESFFALIQIENFDILDKFYDSRSIERIEILFADAIIELCPYKNIFEKVFNLGNGLFAITTEYENIIKQDSDIEKNFKNFIQKAKESSISLENIDYDFTIILSYYYGNKNVYENAKYGMEKAILQNKNLIFANNLVKEAHETAKKNITTLHMVKKALDSSNIISYFQPIIKNSTKEIIKYESLVRLINEEGKVISPYYFLDVSKKGTYYTKITNRVIESSFKVLDHIKHNVSINLSVIDIENTQIRNKLIDLVSNPSYKGRVTFELLEDENIKDFQKIKDFIHLAKKEGKVKIAIDDFGSGYSNFERLLEYEPDILKLDGSLIKNIETNSFSRNIVETLVSFAKKQNIETIAEYVENENIYKILTQMGVDYSQGFYFGRPEKLI